MDILYRPIGVVHSPFDEPAGMPIQPCFARGAAGHVEIFEEFADGLADLEGFSHLHLIYHLHRSRGWSLRVTPYLDDRPRRLFATRAPHEYQVRSTVVTVEIQPESVGAEHVEDDSVAR